MLRHRRIVPGILLGNYLGPSRAMTEVTLAVDALTAEDRDTLLNVHLIQNVGQIEALTTADPDRLGVWWKPEYVQMVRPHTTRLVGLTLREMKTRVDHSQVQGVLHAIRARLLDFLIKLGEQYPDLLAEADAPVRVQPEIVDLLADQIIFNLAPSQGPLMSKQQVNITGDNNTVGNVVAATRIADSFNRVEGVTDPTVIELMRQLTQALTVACAALPADQAGGVADDCETLAKEAAKLTPRPGVIRSVAEAMTAAIKVAGPAAAPALTLLAALVKHFGG